MKHTFVNVADEVGVTEGTVRKVFRNHVLLLEEKYRFETPEVLGVDEIHLLGRARAVFTNITETTLIEMLPDRYKSSVTGFMRSLDPKMVKAVTSDMWKDYHSAAREVFPSALIVVDKFHVVKMANEAVEHVRRTVAKETASKRRSLMRKRKLMLMRMDKISGIAEEKLSGIIDGYPEIYEAYILKEMFFGIYDQPNQGEALRAYQEWLGSITPEMEPYFQPLVRACKNFHEPIFNYWRMPYTNAYTEGINSFIRGIHNLGRGYSFEVLRAKMLFSQKAMVTARKIDKNHMYLRLNIPFYGTDLSTLTGMMSAYDF